ncbi:Cytolethal distending toxin subunit A [Campylobacter jejuni]|uniref:toxin n=1 Tax=Campylobacter jejuni TaxID=197 RepID=UPI000316184A|nr:toxin [Campylobacter jejuni]CEF59080.1 Cytolethal distending toxin subunit A [Campylobacter jejuni]
MGRSFGEFEDTNSFSLKLGLEPIFPTNQEIPSLISNADLVLITPIYPTFN